MILEQPDNTTPFRDDANLLKYGYLLEAKSELNPDALPVGFVMDHDDRNHRDWLGFNCAACHTAQLDYKGVSYRIDGGPSLSDVSAFLFGVTDALKATRDQEEKVPSILQKDPRAIRTCPTSEKLSSSIIGEGHQGT